MEAHYCKEQGKEVDPNKDRKTDNVRDKPGSIGECFSSDMRVWRGASAKQPP